MGDWFWEEARARLLADIHETAARLRAELRRIREEHDVKEETDA